MNKRIQNQIAFLLKTYQTYYVPLIEIEKHLLTLQGTSLFEVSRELKLMQDKNMVEKLPNQPEHWRLTSHGDYMSSPFLTRVMIYFTENILPIIAIAISFLGLLISVVATVIAAFALHKP